MSSEALQRAIDVLPSTTSSDAALVRELAVAAEGRANALEARGEEENEEEDENPLHTAIDAGEAEKVARLLREFPEKAGDRDVDGYGNTPLHVAVEHGDVDIVKLLLNTPQGRETATTEGLYGTPLHNAIRGGHAAIAELLLGTPQGLAAAKMRDRDGNTPLHKAALKGDLGTAKLLYSVYPEAATIQGSDGETPAEMAQRMPWPDAQAVAALLREAHEDDDQPAAKKARARPW
jgi:ankyrin repeat protein